MPFRKALNKEPSPLVCLDLGSCYCKSDGLYSQSQMASMSTSYLGCDGPHASSLFGENSKLNCPFQGTQSQTAEHPCYFFSSSSVFFPRSRKCNKEQCSWCKLTTDFWVAINVFPVLLSAPFLEMYLAFSKHKNGIYAGHTYLKSHSWVAAINSGIPTFYVKLRVVKTYSLFNLLFYCLITQNSLQMTLTPC